MSVLVVRRLVTLWPVLVGGRHGVGRWAQWLPIAALAAVTVAFYPEIVLPSWILADYDVWTYFYPLRAYAARAIQEGRFPLWNPDTFLGAPFFANPQTSVLYPGSVLFYVLPVPYAYSLSVLLHVFLCAALTFVLLQRALGVGSTAATIGACAFAVGGFVSSQVGHINQLSATALAPGIIFLALTAMRQRSLRRALAGALLFAMQLLAGHAQESYMTLWMVGMALGWQALREANGSVEAAPVCGRPAGVARRLAAPTLRALAVAAAIAVGGFALAAVQLLPTAELAAHSIRGGGMSYEEATSFSLPPNLLARSLMPGYWSNPFGEYIGYVGGVALAFAGVGFVFGARGVAWFGFTLAAIGLVLAIGGANPFAPTMYSLIPGLNLFRVPARWLLVYSLGAAVLVAVGTDWALSRAARHAHPPEAPPRETQSSQASIWRIVVLVACAVGIGATALWPSPSVPGRLLALWALALGTGGLLIALASRVAAPTLGALMLAAVLVDLRAAAMDLPQRYAVPAEVATMMRPVPSYLIERNQSGRLLSVARTEYELEDIAQVDARHPGLAATARFWFTTAMKLDEVMSPNTPLRYGLSTADGYDGGVLPLRRYVEFSSLLVPREELRPDGVLRTRLIAVPETRYLDLLGVEAVIAGKSVDVELDGVRFDVATARRLQPGDRLRVRLAQPVPLAAVGLLASVSNPTTESHGELVLTQADERSLTLSLQIGSEVFGELTPGASAADQPTAGPSRAPRTDTAVRLAVPSEADVTTLEWRWFGPGTLAVRAATAIATDGTQRQLVLEEGLTRVDFPTMKVFERPRTPATSLIPEAEVRDDAAALAWMRTANAAELQARVILAPEAGLALPADAGAPPGAEGDRPGSMRRMSRTPERIVYDRDAEGAPGYLLVPDAWFPGWRAEIDGQPAAVYRADLLFKAVWVPREAREVVLTYEPASLRTGAAISAAGLALWIALMLRGRRAVGSHRR